MASQQRAVSREEAQTAFARILLERIRQDQYPSWTQIQILEQCLPRSMQREYLNVLFEKVLRDRRPSITMLRHIAQLLQRL